MDLTSFNKLTLRVRGDGRGYIVNLKTNLHFAEMHQDLWSYMFFTRGGPYWQDISVSKLQSEGGFFFDLRYIFTPLVNELPLFKHNFGK